MKKQIWLYLTMLVLIFATIGAVKHYDDRATRTEESSQRSTALLPAALDAFYPPQADRPLFTMKMLEMEFPFTGIVVDVLEEDIENARGNYEKFRTLYVELSKLIPEWEHKFPIGPVDELGTALQTGHPGAIMGAIENVGMVCHNCHVPNMVRVQQKYHWPDFDMISVQDPLTNDILDYSMFMRYLNVNFTGIFLNLERGNIENAQRYFQGFKARFETLQESCQGCHDTERMYYVDESIQSQIRLLGQTLEQPTIDPQEVMGIAMGIGMQSCHKCHMVHLPAVFAKKEWKKLE
jgi:hypothetical protein